MEAGSRYRGLLRCPSCAVGLLEIESATGTDITCAHCAATFPLRDGVIDLLPAVGASSMAQRTMESPAIVRVYEGRLVRRNPLLAFLLGISFEREQELIVRGANLAGSDRVLDLAGGPGIYSRVLARRLRTGVVVHLDLSWPMLAYASRRSRAEGIENIVCVHGTALRLPFPNGHFDFVLCSGALHLFPDVGLVLREVHRVLKPLGRFTVATFRRRGGRATAFISRMRQRWLGLGDFTKTDLDLRFRDAGFSQTECHHAKGIWLIMSAQK